MSFRDVLLINGGKYSEEKLQQNKLLMRYWENLRDLFDIHLPKDFQLLGFKRLKIIFGQFEGDAYQPDHKDCVITFRRNDFSFDEFLELSEKQRNEKSLFYIEDSLIKICDEIGSSNQAKDSIRETAESIRESKFEHFRTHSKTSKWHRSRKLRATTELHFKSGGIAATITVADKTGNTLMKHILFESRFWESVWFDLWKGYWHGNKFVIETRVGEKYFETKGFSEIAI